MPDDGDEPDDQLDELAAAIARHAVPQWADTAVPRLTLVRLDGPVEPVDLVYEPMVCFVAGGAKRTVAGERSWTVGRGGMFLSSLEVPVTAVFEQVPYRSAVVRLDRQVLADLLLVAGPSAAAEPPGALDSSTALMPPELVGAVLRWVRLLDSPDDIGPLAQHVEAEVLHRLLRTPLGPLLRRCALAGSRETRVRSAAALIRARYVEPLTVDDVCAAARMSPATLHRHFKAATGMSPLQFQKRLRLQEARRLLVAGAASAAQVASAVGYASATQFSRDYRRAYDAPPVQDATRLRKRLVG